MIGVRSIQAASFVLVVVVAAMAFDAPPAMAATCGVIVTPWPIPVNDPDCDGFSSTIEDEALDGIGTYPYVLCPATATPNDEIDAWPLDFDDNQSSNVGDVLKYKGRSPSTVPPQPKRIDLNNDNKIDIFDVMKFKGRVPASCAIAPQAPTASRSWYVSRMDGLWSQGCGEANSLGPADSLVVLAFGRPWYQDGGYGVLLPGGDVFATMTEVETAAKDFLRGFWDCSDDTPSKHLTLVIGTSNCVNFPPKCPPQAEYSDWWHGVAWAGMVNQVNGWIDTWPSYRSRETAWGGIDIELDWNTPQATRNWVGGYDSVDNWRYVNFGTADGCPPYPLCNNGWTQEDVYYVSYVPSPAWPLPEIYTIDGVNARTWQLVSKDASWMDFKGALTQRAACDQNPGSPDCVGADNTPGLGWQQLWVLLNGTMSTSDQPDWSTDIKWWQ